MGPTAAVGQEETVEKSGESSHWSDSDVCYWASRQRAVFANCCAEWNSPT